MTGCRAAPCSSGCLFFRPHCLLVPALSSTRRLRDLPALYEGATRRIHSGLLRQEELRGIRAPTEIRDEACGCQATVGGFC